MSSRPRAALVVGLPQRGQTWVGGVGTTSPGAGHTTLDGTTIFEVGSITTVFTGIALADSVDRGAVKLDDSAASLLTPGFSEGQSKFLLGYWSRSSLRFYPFEAVLLSVGSGFHRESVNFAGSGSLSSFP